MAAIICFFLSQKTLAFELLISSPWRNTLFDIYVIECPKYAEFTVWWGIFSRAGTKLIYSVLYFSSLFVFNFLSRLFRRKTNNKYKNSGALVLWLYCLRINWCPTDVLQEIQEEYKKRYGTTNWCSFDFYDFFLSTAAWLWFNQRKLF